jgi:hypothetical protein
MKPTLDEVMKKLERLMELSALSSTQSEISLALCEASQAASNADREAFQKAWETALTKSADFLDQAHALMDRLEGDDASQSSNP